MRPEIRIVQVHLNKRLVSMFPEWTLKFVAERAGFEPAVRLPLHTLSKRAPSTTRTPLPILRSINQKPVDCMSQTAEPQALNDCGLRNGWSSGGFFGRLPGGLGCARVVRGAATLHLPIYILAQLDVFEAALASHDCYVILACSYSITFARMPSKSYVFL